MNLKIPDTSFCFFPFANIKKRMLINLAQFLLILFLNTKKATYESQNTRHNFLPTPLFKY